jgi:hypothetical protein
MWTFFKTGGMVYSANVINDEDDGSVRPVSFSAEKEGSDDRVIYESRLRGEG